MQYIVIAQMSLAALTCGLSLHVITARIMAAIRK